MRGFFFTVLFCVAILFGRNALSETEIVKQDYSAVDEYAKNAPEFKNMADLVSYLIKPYRGNEELKARVIFAWMVFHLQYDNYKATNISNHNNHQKSFIKNTDPYQTRLGVCGDFAELFNKMARKAHLDSEKITGSAGYGLTTKTAAQSPHAWNAVKINKKWQLLDVTWAMGGQYTSFSKYQKPKEYKKMLKDIQKSKTKPTPSDKRTITDFWFLTDPKEMIKTHFPSKIKWQLLQHPVTPHKVWKENEKSQKTSDKQKKK